MRAEALRVAIGTIPHPGNERGIRITSTMGGTLYRPGEAAAELDAPRRRGAVRGQARRPEPGRLGVSGSAAWTPT